MPITDLYSPAYWRLQRMMFRQELTETILNVLFAGAESGLEQMPGGFTALMDWDVFNEAALDWMRLYLGESGEGAILRPERAWIQEINETTRQQVMREIDNWVREGAELDVLKRRLAPIFGERRAASIATTEVTRMYASGNLMAWQSSGLVGAKRWMTAVDERVCPICGPLHNKIVEIDQTWEFTPEMLAANPQLKRALGNQPASYTAPPAHPNCRCWLQPVVFEALEPEEIEEGTFA